MSVLSDTPKKVNRPILLHLKNVNDILMAVSETMVIAMVAYLFFQDNQTYIKTLISDWLTLAIAAEAVTTIGYVGITYLLNQYSLKTTLNFIRAGTLPNLMIFAWLIIVELFALWLISIGVNPIIISVLMLSYIAKAFASRVREINFI